jgi:hypothetical protein
VDLLVWVVVLAVGVFGAKVVWPWAQDRWFAGHSPANGELVEADRAATPPFGPVETGHQPASRLRLRGMTRWLSLGFFGLIGLGLVGWAAYEGTNRDNPQANLPPAGVVGLTASGLAVMAFARRAWMRGIDADAEGVVVTNLFKTHRLAWSELVDISFDEVMNDGGGTAYHRLRLKAEGPDIVAEAPGGSAESGSQLDRARADLLAMRDEAVRKSL